MPGNQARFFSVFASVPTACQRMRFHTLSLLRGKQACSIRLSWHRPALLLLATLFRFSFLYPQRPWGACSSTEGGIHFGLDMGPDQGKRSAGRRHKKSGRSRFERGAGFATLGCQIPVPLALASQAALETARTFSGASLAGFHASAFEFLNTVTYSAAE